MQALQMRTGLLAAMLLLAIGPWVHAATPSHRSYVDGELLVKYRESRASERALHYRAMWRLSTVRTFEKSGLRKVRLPSDMTMNQALAIYRSDPEVLYAEPNFRYRLLAIPNDAGMGNLWGLVNDGSAGTADADMDADQAWDLETGSRDIVVAVVDSGVDANHPDLAANIWTNPGETPENGVDDDNNGYVDDVHGWDFADDDNHPNDPVDSHGHGTHVAGIIGALGNNGVGVVGVCWQVSIMPLRFITAADYGTTEDAINAIRYATDNGADVINLSWGGSGYSQALKDAIDDAGLAGALVVCAAGNDGNNLDAVKTYPASYDSANILSVGASDADDEPAWFTNFSDSLVDVAAPGTAVFSTVPDRRTLLSDDFSTLSNLTAGGDMAWGLQSIGGEVMLTESPTGDYSDNLDAWVSQDPLDLSGASGSRLDFRIFGNTAGAGDRLTVEASSNNGATWTPLWVGLDNGPVQAVTGPIGTSQLAIADLKAYDGVGSLHIRFRFTSDADGTADGYLIDDLTVTCADTTYGADDYQSLPGNLHVRCLRIRYSCSDHGPEALADADGGPAAHRINGGSEATACRLHGHWRSSECIPCPGIGGGRGSEFPCGGHGSHRPGLEHRRAGGFRIRNTASTGFGQ